MLRFCSSTSEKFSLLSYPRSVRSIPEHRHIVGSGSSPCDNKCNNELTVLKRLSPLKATEVLPIWCHVFSTKGTRGDIQALQLRLRRIHFVCAPSSHPFPPCAAPSGSRSSEYVMLLYMRLDTCITLIAILFHKHQTWYKEICERHTQLHSHVIKHLIHGFWKKKPEKSSSQLLNSSVPRSQ